MRRRAARTAKVAAVAPCVVAVGVQVPAAVVQVAVAEVIGEEVAAQQQELQHRHGGSNPREKPASATALEKNVSASERVLLEFTQAKRSLTSASTCISITRKTLDGLATS